jgi:large subunit ribosomal protein L6
MSRIGKLPVVLPPGVTAVWTAPELTVQGPKGQLSVRVLPPCGLEIGEGAIRLTRPDDARTSKVAQGLYRALVNNVVVGVSQGYQKRLEVMGVGYKAEAAGKVLKLSLGFANVKEFPVPDGVTVSVDKNFIVVQGMDKQVVGDTAARIRSHRPPEPYKGKGIRYEGEHVRRKAGKAATGGKG